MSNVPSLDSLLRALSSAPVGVRDITTIRANEAHCRVSAADVKELGTIVCRDLGGELILMAADDRRRDAGAFLVHYLFAHPAGNWFLHASLPVDDTLKTAPSQVEPGIPSLA